MILTEGIKAFAGLLTILTAKVVVTLVAALVGATVVVTLGLLRCAIKVAITVVAWVK